LLVYLFIYFGIVSQGKTHLEEGQWKYSRSVKGSDPAKGWRPAVVGAVLSTPQRQRCSLRSRPEHNLLPQAARALAAFPRNLRRKWNQCWVHLTLYFGSHWLLRVSFSAGGPDLLCLAADLPFAWCCVSGSSPPTPVPGLPQPRRRSHWPSAGGDSAGRGCSLRVPAPGLRPQDIRMTRVQGGK